MDLFEELGLLHERMSSFRRVALHVHSPASHDWPRDPATNGRTFLLEEPAPYLECLGNHYDLVAVTDHMQSWFACGHCAASTDCVVLPGMELNVRFRAPLESVRMHFVAVFPAGHSTEKISGLFRDHPHIPDDRHRTGKEDLVVSDLGELVRTVTTLGGILIAAHVDNGHRSAFRAQGGGALELVRDDGEVLTAKAQQLCDRYKEELIRAGVHAVEVKGPTDAAHYRFTLGRDRVSIAAVLRNDAHSLADIAANGCTYVKMSECSLEGLRLALRFPETRIRHARPASASPVIQGLRIEGGGGCFSDATLGFSPNLTCIIGARGTGKSTAVDAIRYIFGYNRGMGKGIGEELAGQIRGRQEATLGGATLHLAYRSAAGERFRLTAAYSPSEDYATEVCDESGRPCDVANVEVHPDFPCRLFGWSEIEKLGRDPSRQRKLLDRVLNLHQLIASRDALLRELEADRKQVEALATQLEVLYGQCASLQRLSELRATYQVLRDPEVDGLFGRAEAEARNVSQAKDWASALTEWAGSLEAQAQAQPVRQLGEDVKKGWGELGGPEAVLAIQKAVASLVAASRSLKQTSAKLQEHFVTRHRGAVTRLEQELRERKAPAAARKRGPVGTQLQKAEEEERLYGRKLQDLMRALKRRQERLADLQQLVARISEERRLGAEDLNTRLDTGSRPRIRLSVIPSADLSAHEAWIVAALKKSGVHHTKQRRIVVALRPVFQQGAVARTVLKGQLGQFGLSAELISDIKGAVGPFAKDPGSGAWRVQTAVLGALLQADECIADDVIEVTLDSQPIAGLSPGQVSSALLPIILMGSADPLVLDQPEDNLDNQLVASLLISTLQQLKERRQIIVVTHNPNIVVNGDAEQVIVMDWQDGKCAVRRQASIDDTDVMEDIVELMEGGREAIVGRYKRYWPDKELPQFLRD